MPVLLRLPSAPAAEEWKHIPTLFFRRLKKEKKILSKGFCFVCFFSSLIFISSLYSIIYVCLFNFNAFTYLQHQVAGP